MSAHAVERQRALLDYKLQEWLKPFILAVRLGGLASKEVSSTAISSVGVNFLSHKYQLFTIDLLGTYW